MKNREIKILLAAPRGFCAGVERAIEIVEKEYSQIWCSCLCTTRNSS